jgi:hypothetical protein
VGKRAEREMPVAVESQGKDVLAEYVESPPELRCFCGKRVLLRLHLFAH